MNMESRENYIQSKITVIRCFVGELFAVSRFFCRRVVCCVKIYIIQFFHSLLDIYLNFDFLSGCRCVFRRLGIMYFVFLSFLFLTVVYDLCIF